MVGTRKITRSKNSRLRRWAISAVVAGGLAGAAIAPTSAFAANSNCNAIYQVLVYFNQFDGATNGQLDGLIGHNDVAQIAAWGTGGAGAVSPVAKDAAQYLQLNPALFAYVDSIIAHSQDGLIGIADLRAYHSAC
jgi:hypothetical protein